MMTTIRRVLGLTIVAVSLAFTVGCDGEGGGAPGGGAPAGGGGAAAPGAGG